jgi:protocatechuate 3,4-dioxygenase beta subunit
MTMPPPHDRPIGTMLARRDVLAMIGASAGGAVLIRWVPERNALGPSSAAAVTPACVVRPTATEGPFFVDERLNRSDIRSDPTDGSVCDGTRLALELVVSRVDGGACTPFPNVVVDLWHCDAAGVYSGVQDRDFDTRGKQFLRGYQATDASGVARFVTIYPGWYAGRTVHLHVKLRTDPDASTGFEFTSQMYFDDALTDAVFAAAPYAAKGTRSVRNAEDFIYQNGGDQLVLAVIPDGAGGYATSFAIGIETGAVTTTTLVGCTTIPACLTALQATLPVPESAMGRKAELAAHRLRRRLATVARWLERANASEGGRRSRRYARARTAVRALVKLARRAATNGALDVALAPLEKAADALLLQIPA